MSNAHSVIHVDCHLLSLCFSLEVELPKSGWMNTFPIALSERFCLIANNVGMDSFCLGICFVELGMYVLHTSTLF